MIKLKNVFYEISSSFGNSNAYPSPGIPAKKTTISIAFKNTRERLLINNTGGHVEFKFTESNNIAKNDKLANSPSLGHPADAFKIYIDQELENIINDGVLAEKVQLLSPLPNDPGEVSDLVNMIDGFRYYALGVKNHATDLERAA